VAMYTPQVPQ